MKRAKETRTGKPSANGNARPSQRAATVVQQPRRPEQPGKEAKGGFHRLDEETITYFQEVKSHFDTLDDPEEQALLVGNVLGETAGKEVKVCTDAVCSRILEALIPAAQPEQLIGFIDAFLAGQGEAFCELSAGPFGSRVAERLLVTLGARVDSAPDQASEAAASTALERACGVVTAHLYEFATDRNASHVARRLLCVAAGRDVLPAAGRAAGGVDGASHGKARAGAARLAAAQHSAPAEERAPPRHPGLLCLFGRALLSTEWPKARLEELLYHAYAAPWLQALLLALQGDTEILWRLIPRLLGAPEGPAAAEGEGAGAPEEGGLFEGVPAAHVHGMMQEQTSSHVLEVIMRVAPQPMLAELHSRFLRGSLASLAAHACANFVVQAYLAALASPQQVKGALRELRDALPQLLQRRRAGVAAALLAAAARCGGGGGGGNAAVQTDAARALVSALRALASQQGDALGDQGLAGALLTLDTGVALGQSGRLSAMGCAMLAMLLRMPKEAGSEVAEALAALPEPELLHAGADAAGSHALEAFLAGPAAGAKARKRLLRQLRGGYGRLAATPGGSHVVQAAYRAGGLKDKEAIAAELAAGEAHIAATNFGQILLKRCAVDAFKRSGDAWRAHAQSAAALRSEFAELLGDDDANAPAATSAATSAAAAAGGAGVAAAAPAQARKRKRECQAPASCSEPAEALGDGGGIDGISLAATSAAAEAGKAGGAPAAAQSQKGRKKRKAPVLDGGPAEAPAGAGGDGAASIGATAGNGRAKGAAAAEQPRRKKRKGGSEAALAASPVAAEGNDGEREYGAAAEQPMNKKAKKKRQVKGPPVNMDHGSALGLPEAPEQTPRKKKNQRAAPAEHVAHASTSTAVRDKVVPKKPKLKKRGTEQAVLLSHMQQQ